MGPEKKNSLISMALYFQMHDQCLKGCQIAFQFTGIPLSYKDHKIQYQMLSLPCL
jgi:hypothetical protein